MNTRFLILLTTLALVGLSGAVLAAKEKPCQPWPGCKDEEPPPPPPPPPGDLYTVELLDGPFRFGPVVVTVNSKGNLESSAAVSLVMERPNYPGSDASDPAETAWNLVFDNCAGNFGTTTDSIAVGPNDWGVGKNSATNIHVDLENIILAQGSVRKEIQIHLRGNPGADFLPVCNAGPGSVESVEFNLDYYTVWGKRWSGPGRSWNTCYHFDPSDSSSVIPEESDPFPASSMIISIPCPE